jgi:hypothetical protein
MNLESDQKLECSLKLTVSTMTNDIYYTVHKVPETSHEENGV